MKWFVKVVSFIILIVLSVIDIIMIAFYAFGFMLSIDEYRGITPLSEAGDYEFFESLFGRPLTILFMVIFLVMILIVLAEFVAKLILYIKAVKEKSYKKYLTLSIVSLAEEIINTAMMLLFGINLVINLDAIHKREEDIIMQGATVWFFTYLFMAFWIILNFLSAHQCVKDEKIFGPER